MRESEIQAKAVADICKHMALCHSVIIDPETQNYNSTSPDELALVEGAKRLGYEFKSRTSEGEITIKMEEL
jgi:magnesium-transporting ATPase (P-type)